MSLGAGGCAPALSPVTLPVMQTGSPAFVRALEAYTGTPVVAGNAIEILSNGDEFFPAQLTAIRAARTTITYAQYYYGDGKIARTMADALAERCRAGVEVSVLLDGFGTLAMPGDYTDLLERAGCDVATFRPLTNILGGRANNRNHRRILVVDGRLGFTGGAGVSEKWAGDGVTPGHWRDTEVRVEGPVVQYLQGAFAESWLEATGVVLAGEGYFPPLAPVGDVEAHVVTSSPAKGDFAVATMFLLAINGAQRSILITNPYFAPGRRLTEALMAARARGVRVVVLVPGEIDWNIVRATSRSGFGPLLGAGVEIYEYRAALLHAKTMVIDDLWCTVGTTNLDNRSFTLNAEVNVVMYSHDVASRLARIFAEDLTHARRVDLDRWRARPLWQKLLEILARPLRKQL